MATNTEYLAELEKAIRRRCRCSATHRQTVMVHEQTEDNQTIWFGEVEVFELTGCKDSNTCYAWEDIKDGVRIISILHSRIVDSPRRAVQAAIFTGVQAPLLAPAGDPAVLRRNIEKAKSVLHEVQIKAEALEGMMQTVQQTAVSTQVILSTNGALDEPGSQTSASPAESEPSAATASEESRVHIFGSQKENRKCKSQTSSN